MSSGASLTSRGEGASSALVGNPSSDGVMIKMPFFFYFLFFSLGFTPCEAEQPLRGMELQEKKKAQKRLQATENLFKKNLQLKDVC